ncbi:hypothetical protein ACVIJW_009759 [Bradyrhizobium barranii subsp. barranii]
MSEMTPTPLGRRRRTVLLALAIFAILSTTVPMALTDELHSDLDISLQKMQTTRTRAIPAMSAPSTKTSGLLRISAPHYCAGADVIDGIVSGNVAPIIRYMRGWRIECMIVPSSVKLVIQLFFQSLKLL